MKLYYHQTSGGAKYLFDTYTICPNGHREGRITDKTKYVVRIDGDITKDAELNVREAKADQDALGLLQDLATRFEEICDNLGLNVKAEDCYVDAIKLIKKSNKKPANQ
jgi:hypothetical protein